MKHIQDILIIHADTSRRLLSELSINKINFEGNGKHETIYHESLEDLVWKPNFENYETIGADTESNSMI